MHPNLVVEVPKWALQVLNNLCDIERKLSIHGDPGNAKRNVERIKEVFEDQKLFYEDPIGEKFSETRTDIEASITGSGTENLVVVEVIKPIIRAGDETFSKVVQKGIVIVESKSQGGE
ncbi:hypothetical protein AEP_00858 [Curvibacter sp. AEP1-3]|uniref:hypothetical protein n=1 Tax=Curvibacter sp. AEP1-3 TaxID=1844971 RepID=UPI000B583C56|nr:hypothetical protein [Curvibacter sp. AEP1-3]ARV17815.1 hypothetical protein AEP_00858 [Curvibacter sp. AEP1-3]